MKPFVTTPTSSEEIIYGVKEIHCKMKTINAQARANNQVGVSLQENFVCSINNLSIFLHTV